VGQLISFINSLFQLPDQLLNEAIQFLNHLALVSAAGINLSDYISWLGVLDSAWQGVIESLLGSVALIGILTIVRSVYGIYLSAKQGIKWW